MPKETVWVKIKTADGSAPSARLGHSLVEMEKDFYVLYGGLDANSRVEGNILPNGQVYTLKFNQKSEYVWSLTDCDGEEIPLPRTNHAACKIGKNEMFVFGGFYTSKKRFNDVHILKTNLGIYLFLCSLKIMCSLHTCVFFYESSFFSVTLLFLVSN